MSQIENEIKLLKALAHPIRLKIIKKLADGELCVCKLNEDVEFSQSNLSQHLRILREAKVVKARKEGMWIHYSILDRKILDIIGMIEELSNITND
ncbi:cadmium resistance transcriptional regulatory protein CadC [Gottschalkia purinilytica]|uniref:Cadmium resistance transcriptional regulatory protein CadC n=1 Tax=Gottschalkia purinilytica TaxID=1503 RepID=A0A0L0WEU4_GOTPU|nr:metalloregulator ArsR/SmtB family transcription factor [Gottschalkia purinilytica]KNF09984.1 cadmium resistance transcriptional regulatory protein CadC [Gottschalkia purinilytica]